MTTTQSLAVQVYSPKYGDIWKARCPDCTWTSTRLGALPFETEKAALHCLDLHKALCKDGGS